MKPFLLIAVIALCSCRDDSNDPEKVGACLCDCYQKTIAKRGVDTGIWYCDSMMEFQSRFYRIYRENNFGIKLLTPVSGQTMDSVYEFSSNLHLYIGEHCEGYFYNQGK